MATERKSMPNVERLFNWNLEAWTRLGYLDKRKRLLACTIISAPIVVSMFVMPTFFMGVNTFEQHIYNFYMIIVTSSSVARAILIIIKQRKILDLLNDMENWFVEVQEQNDNNALETLNKLTQKVRRYSKYTLWWVIIFGAFLSFQPICTGYGKFVYDTQIPGIDLHQSPLYEIMYGFQSLWVIPMACVSSISYADTLLIFISFGIFATKQLQRKLKDISQMDEQQGLENIKKCVQYHWKIIKFGEDLENAYSLMCLLDFSLYCVTLCMLLFYSVMDFTWALMFQAVVVELILTLLIFLTTFLADIFTQESLNVAQTAYDMNWLQRDKAFRVAVLLIILRSQRPLILTAGGIQPLNLETFLAIMRSSYSFFSVLRGVM
ncbi:odorant receptor 49b-like [Ceratitis capitata]|uniref:odorant receptor 49b-like n=1 Tax=Ceratitis capitata TaxID=7213 RepID=UPI000A10D24D|nr:odorant receptor 49b-like [Ceratitis capitata]